MTNPVLVEVIRGSLLESEHRGSAAVIDADGKPVLLLGDVARPVFPRSAVKPLQALALVESGAADRFGFGNDELALASASHSGEPAHVASVERMLARAGLDAGALACGAHPPIHAPSAQALARSGRDPSALHNNCSGKHAGFLCAACSVPTWPLPLEKLAYAFARFGTGRGLEPRRAAAAGRILAACAARPHLVAGTGRFCTRTMEHFGERVLLKGGAEGVFCGALPQSGIGIAIKCEDGAARAAEVVMAALISRLLVLDDADRAALAPLVRPALRNWNGIEVGGLRPSELLAQRA